MNFEGKKLLFLGQSLSQAPSIRCAKEMGCTGILANFGAYAPGMEYADYYESLVSGDESELLQIANKYHIDGIVAFTDVFTYVASSVAESLGLHGNPKESTQTLRCKDLFRQFQKEHGMNAPDFIVVNNQHELTNHIRELDFPLVVKPVDSTCTLGQSVIQIADEAADAFEKAMQYSQYNRVIFEEFLESDMMELDGDILVGHGKLAFRHYGHNYFLKNRLANVPSGEIFPGFYGEHITSQLDEQFQIIISALDFRSGCMNFDAIVSGGKVHIIDIGVRNGGNFVPDVIKMSTGFDLRKATIYNALGQDYPAPYLCSSSPEPVASYLIASRSEGILENITFHPELEPFVHEYHPFKKPGEKIFPYTVALHTLGVMLMKFPDMDILQTTIDNIEELVEITLRSLPSESCEEKI
ncbi:MAG: ATP-grasp domain-containing protein [Desulfobacterales bacterium]|nr:ATP-grasp domain-containing protein [Desulfobacterales bacterium]